MDRYHIYDDYDTALPAFDTGGRYDPMFDVTICPNDIRCNDVDCTREHVHVFTDDDLGRGGHVPVDDRHRPWYGAVGSEPTHVAIPIDQYRRIFGEA